MRCKERLRDLGLFSLEEGRFVGTYSSLPVPTRRLLRRQSQALVVVSAQLASKHHEATRSLFPTLATVG